MGEQLTWAEEEPLATEEDCFCSAEDKKLMKEVYYLLRKAENTAAELIVVGWAGDRKGPIWDKISRSTENKQIFFSSTEQSFCQ